MTDAAPAMALQAATVLNPSLQDVAIEGRHMANDEQNEQHHFPAISGFRSSVPPDQPDLLLFELKSIDAGIIRFSMTREAALSFGDQVRKAAAASTGYGLSGSGLLS